VDALSSVFGLKKVAPYLDMAERPIVSAILVIGVVPILEEYLFRGLILRGLLTHCRPRTAVLISALLFATTHGNLRQFILAMVIGFVFGWWYVRTRSVGPGIIGHAAFNAVAWTASQLPDLATALGLNSMPKNFAHTPWWFFTGGLILTFVGCWSVYQVARDVGPPPLVFPVVEIEVPPVLAQPPRLDCLPSHEDPAARASAPDS
jgi:hypothetical protein